MDDSIGKQVRDLCGPATVIGWSQQDVTGETWEGACDPEDHSSTP